jgi:hypothetical protein
MMWLLSLIILLPTGWMALDIPLSDQLNRGIGSLISTDGTLTDQKMAIAFIAGSLVAATPFHIILRYLATLVHELGHAFTAGILGARPRTITIAPSSSGLATYEAPRSWGRGRISIVTFAGYPAPAIASLAAINAVRSEHTYAWFLFASATLATSLILLIRNAWGVTWTLLSVVASCFIAKFASLQILGIVLVGLSGYLAIEGIRHTWTQIQIVRHRRGSGCDAEKIGDAWPGTSGFFAWAHLVSVVCISTYAATRAVSPYSQELIDWVQQQIN